MIENARSSVHAWIATIGAVIGALGAVFGIYFGVRDHHTPTHVNPNMAGSWVFLQNVGPFSANTQLNVFPKEDDGKIARLDTPLPGCDFEVSLKSLGDTEIQGRLQVVGDGCKWLPDRAEVVMSLSGHRLDVAVADMHLQFNRQ